jgi:hypothetical protein
LLDIPHGVGVSANGEVNPKQPHNSLCQVSSQPLSSSILFIRLLPAPQDFPNSLQRKYGSAVPVDGETAWWISFYSIGAPPGSKVPASEFNLLAVKDGYLVSVQAETKNQAESLARQTMDMILSAM